MKTIDGTHVPLAAKDIRCDVRASITWRRVRRSEARPRAVSPRRRMRRAQQKTRERCISRGFFTPSSNRIASTQSMVPGTGLEPASQLRRRIFVTLLLSKPASRARTVRALDYAFTVARGRNRCPCALGAPRLVSTPSSLQSYREAWLGVASMRASGVSPNLKGSAPAVSDRALNLLSPLCLPISSPRQKGGRDSTIACTPPPHLPCHGVPDRQRAAALSSRDRRGQTQIRTTPSIHAGPIDRAFGDVRLTSRQ